MGNIFGVAELFFPDLELFFWKSARCNEIWIFLPFWQNMLLGWLKNNRKCYGALKTGVWRCKSWEKFVLTCFDLFLTCLLTIWPFFCLGQKIWDRLSEKKIYGQNLIFHMQKLIWKPKNIPTLLKTPAKIQVM